MTKFLREHPRLIAAVAGSFLVVASGCGHDAQPSAKPSPPAASVMRPAVMAPEPPERPATVRIFTVAQGAGGDDNGLIGQSISVANAQQPATEALKALIDAKYSPLAPGTRLRSLQIANGLATVDFSPEFKKNFHGSDTEEAQALDSILMTMGQFPTIQRVQILVNGSTIDTLGGHMDIPGPLDVIPPTGVKQADSSHDTIHS